MSTAQKIGTDRGAVAGPTTTRAAKKLAGARRRQRLAEVWREFRKSSSGMFGLIVLLVFVVVALAAPVIANESLLDPTQVHNPLNQPPSWANPLGTDPLGRSVLVMLIWGARVSLTVGIAATIMSMLIGTVIGLFAGHYLGWRSSVLMRVIDFFLVVPSLLLAIVLASVLQRGLWTIIIAIGVASWAATARLVRSQTLTIETRGYVRRATALGAGDGYIIGKHVLPGVMPLVLTSTTLAIGSAINAEATLSFLGIGSGETSWGAMLQVALSSGAATAGYWWMVFPPGIAIVVVVLGFTLVGRAIESIINPTLRRR
jgi:peptide/nickel transport system permease protein